jgi:hypothetical protein
LYTVVFPGSVIIFPVNVPFEYKVTPLGKDDPASRVYTTLLPVPSVATTLWVNATFFVTLDNVAAVCHTGNGLAKIILFFTTVNPPDASFSGYVPF